MNEIDCKTLKKTINCEHFEIPFVCEDFMKHKIDIVIDGNGKEKELMPTAAIVDKDDNLVDVICGPILFCSYDKMGENIGLNDEQIMYILSLKDHMFVSDENGKGYMVLKIQQ